MSETRLAPLRIPGTLRTAWIVARKELACARRDKQTLLYTVVLPLALYPALFWVMLQGSSLLKGRDETLAVRVALATSPSDAPLDDDVRAALTMDAELASERSVAPGPLELVESSDARELDAASHEALRERLGGEDGPDAILAWIDGAPELWFDGTRSRSRLARDRVVERLEWLREERRNASVRAAGGDPEALRPFRIERLDLASRRDLSAYLFSFILPMTFVLMAVMGAFYPAVDCTAGEKERGTSETTLLLPGPRLGVQLGKVLAVAVAAFVAATLNLLGLALAAEPLLAASGSNLAIEVPWSNLLLAVPFSAAFLFTTSAILVGVASFTETFKQGQALLGVVQVVFIVPALVAVMPGMELSLGLALVPIVQTVLAFKAVLAGLGASSEPGVLELTVALLSQLAYALFFLWLSMRIATRERVGGTGATPTRLLAAWRAGATPK